MPLEAGFVLANRYRIEETIAIGGMGAIYRAVDDTLGIQVAVKENFFTSNEFSRQFRREATILASLRHPNLPRVTDHFVIQEQGQYLVMDYIEGEDLRQIITRQGSIPEQEVLRIGITISEALTYLHTRNPAIVHRDIKPGNIKVTPSGQAVLVDFGLAKEARGEATTTGAQALTPGYAPPEQYGQGTEPRSDVYALGATLYATLTGKIPEDGLSRAMGTVDLTPMRRHNPLIHDLTARVIEKAMGVRPDERYQTAENFRADLEDARAVLLGQPPAAAEPVQPPRPAPEPDPRDSVQAPVTLPSPAKMVPEERVEPVAPPARRRSAASVMFGMLGIVVFSGLIFGAVQMFSGRAAFFPSPTATNQSPSATLPRPTATATPEPSITPPAATATYAPTETATPAPPASTATPAATPAGGGSGQIAFASNRDGIPQVWVMDADGKQPRKVTHLSDGACQPSWSPDGLQLVFVSPCGGFKESYPGSSLFIIRTDGTGLLPLITLPGGDYEPDWSPDGKQIVFTSLRDGRPHIFLYNLADQNVVRLSAMTNYEQQPAWSPDGTRIAYQTSRSAGKPTIWVMAPDGSSAREFSGSDGGNAYSPDWSPINDMMVYTRAASYLWLVARQIDNPSAQEFKVTERIQPVYDPGFSPDGWWLAFSTKQEDNTDIYIIQRNGGGLTRLTDDPGLDFHPTWRP